MYLRMTSRATSVWIRARSRIRMVIAFLRCSGFPTTPMNTVADLRSPANPTSLTVINPAVSG